MMRLACLRHGLEVPDDDAVEWSMRFRALARELYAQRPGVRHAVPALATLLLIDIGRLAFPGVSVELAARQNVIAELFAVIERRFCEDLSLETAARELARAPESLARLVRRTTGRTVGDWIAERRMAEARRLLLETDELVGVVGEQCGYPDARYFRRRFAEVHGASPSDWRNGQR